MADNKYQVFLDFMTDIKLDKSKVDKYAKDLTESLKKAKPGVEIDESKVKKSIEDIMDSIGSLSKAAKNVDMSINADDAKKALADIEKMMAEMGDIDMSALDKAFSDLPLGELSKLQNMLQDTVSDFDNIKFNNEVQKLADDYSKAAMEAKQLLDTQKLALAAMEKSGRGGSAEYKKLKDEIDNSEKSLKEFEDTFRSVNEIASKPIKTEGFADVLAKFEVMGQVGESLSSFAEKGNEARVALASFSAQTGITGDELEKVRGMADEAFKGGMGESIAENIKSLATAKQMLGQFLDDNGIQEFTQSAAGIAKVFDKDVNEVIGKSRTLIAQFGLDGKQAGDLVALAMQSTGTGMDDTLDTLDEYTQLVKQAGFDANEFIGILTTGSQYGTRDMDKLGDAIKETQIRLHAGDTSKALQGITVPISKSIQEVVKLGEQGKLSVKEVLQQSSGMIKKAFDAGDISASIRDQLSVAMSGTMAEDLGGEMYTKIFSAPIDTAAIAEKAKQAGDQINKSLEPVSISDKIGRELEVLGTKASEYISPVASAVGGVMTEISKVAPGINLMMDYGGKIKDIAVSILSKLVPSLFVQTAATGSATTAQYALNTAMLANPAGLIIAGIAAVAAAAYGLYSILHKSTEEKLKDTEASIELNKKNQEATQQAIKQEQANTNLIAKYEQLTKAKREGKQVDQELRQVREELNKQYPATIDLTKSHDDNLKALKEHTGLLNVDTAKFTETNQALVKEYEKLATQTSRTKSEEDRLRIVKQQLKKEFPGFIEGAGGVTESLKYLKEQSGMVTANMGKLQEKLKGFQKEARELAVIQAKQKLELTRDEALSELSGFVGVAWSDATKEAKNLISGFYNSITRTADPEKLESLIDNYKQKLKELRTIGAEGNRGSKINEQEFNAATSSMIKMYQQRITEVELYSKKVDEITSGSAGTNETNAPTTTAATTAETKKVEDAYELAKKKYEQEKKNNEVAQASFKTTQQQSILDEKRKRDSQDDLLLSENHLKGLEKQKVKLTELFKITEGENGKISIAMKVNDDQANEIKTEFYNVRDEIQSELGKKNDLLLNVDINEDELELALDNLRIREFQANIELGINVDESETEIKSILKKRLDKYLSEIDDNNDKIANLEKQLAGETSEIRKANIKRELNDLKKSNVDKRNSVRDVNDNIRQVELTSYEKRLTDIQEFYDEQKNLIDDRYAYEEDKLNKFQDMFASASDRALGKSSSDYYAGLDAEQADRIKTLDKYKELDLISQESYEQQKADIEEKYRKQREDREKADQDARMAREAMFQGQQIERQRQKDVETLTLEKDRNEREMNLLMERVAYFDANANPVFDSSEDQKAYDKLAKDLDNTTRLLDDKSSIIAQSWNVVGQTMSDGMANAFAGDWEGAADAMKKGFGILLSTLVEELRKELDAVILKQVLSWFKAPEAEALPLFARLAMLPAIYALVSGTLNAFATPLLQGIMSAPTGMRIDSPTLLMAGDGSKLGMPNREWLFNDPQLKQIVASVAMGSNAQLAQELREVKTLLASQTLEATLKGQDIVISMNRTQYANSQRSR